MHLQAIRVYSVITGKQHVKQVNCVWGLFTCGPQVNLHAFAGNLARATFTVYFHATVFSRS